MCQAANLASRYGIILSEARSRLASGARAAQLGLDATFSADAVEHASPPHARRYRDFRASKEPEASLERQGLQLPTRQLTSLGESDVSDDTSHTTTCRQHMLQMPVSSRATAGTASPRRRAVFDIRPGDPGPCHTRPGGGPGPRGGPIRLSQGPSRSELNSDS